MASMIYSGLDIVCAPSSYRQEGITKSTATPRPNRSVVVVWYVVQLVPERESAWPGFAGSSKTKYGKCQISTPRDTLGLPEFEGAHVVGRPVQALFLELGEDRLAVHVQLFGQRVDPNALCFLSQISLRKVSAAPGRAPSGRVRGIRIIRPADRRRSPVRYPTSSRPAARKRLRSRAAKAPRHAYRPSSPRGG